MDAGCLDAWILDAGWSIRLNCNIKAEHQQNFTKNTQNLEPGMYPLPAPMPWPSRFQTRESSGTEDSMRQQHDSLNLTQLMGLLPLVHREHRDEHSEHRATVKKWYKEPTSSPLLSLDGSSTVRQHDFKLRDAPK